MNSLKYFADIEIHRIKNEAACSGKVFNSLKLLLDNFWYLNCADSKNKSYLKNFV